MSLTKQQTDKMYSIVYKALQHNYYPSIEELQEILGRQCIIVSLSTIRTLVSSIKRTF